MFTGEHVHTLDAKGRLTLPAKYRSQLAEGLMITKGEDFCLQIYPLRAWEKKQQEVEALSTASAKNREYRRAFYSSSEDGELDGQGRVLIGKRHRKYAGFEKEIAVIGAGEFVELWGATQWEAQRQASDAALGNRDDNAPAGAGET